MSTAAAATTQKEEEEEQKISPKFYDTCGIYCGVNKYGIVWRRPGSGGDCDCGLTLDNMPAIEELERAIEELGIQPMRPAAHPAYSTYESRLSSFATWPISLKLKPNVFSEAGFFYTGKGDQTICYYCGGGLKDWYENDVPWEQHAKWFSKCNYVLSIKGKEFVDRVCNQKTEHETGIQAETTESAPVTEPVTEFRNIEDTTSASKQSVAISNSQSVAAPPSESQVDSSRLCKICYIEEMGILFLPCGHIVACPKCAISLTTCAVCRKTFSATVRAFFS